MLSLECLNELHAAWLPNISASGLDRVIELLEKDSPLLIHGSFTRAIPMGCLATQVAWNHPRTEHLSLDAGVCWLNHIAGLNPATSRVVRAWDSCGAARFEVRAELLQIFKEHRRRMNGSSCAGPNRIQHLVEA